MKFWYPIPLTMVLMNSLSAFAQVRENEILEETTQKNYTIYEDGKPVRKSVKIHTIIRQDVKFDTMVENKIDASRIETAKEITKMVSIDNDADEDFDETIKFSYASNADKDFLIDVNDKEIFKALENSTYLKVRDQKNLSELQLNEMVVITDATGEIIQLILEEHEAAE